MHGFGHLVIPRLPGLVEFYVASPASLCETAHTGCPVEMNLVPAKTFKPVRIDGFAKCLSAD
jgi:hypothetical protein